jgi:hypothetical protein
MDHCESVPLNLIVSIECARRQWRRLRRIYGPSIEQLAGLEKAFWVSTLQTEGKGFAQIAAELETLRDEIGEASKENRPSETLMRMTLRDIACERGEEYKELLDELSVKGLSGYETLLANLVMYERSFNAPTDAGGMSRNSVASNEGSRKRARGWQ